MTNESFRQYMIELGKKGLRHDGRSLLEYRKPIEVQIGISNNAEGSAMVTIGKTRVACGIKMEIGVPYPDTPDQGSLMVGAEFSPMASPLFEPGAPGEDAIELARIVDRGIRESGAIDVKKLCLSPGEKAWNVLIDIYVQNYDGNLIDASALAALAALLNTKYPKFDGEKVDYHEHTNEPLAMAKRPVACTFAKVSDLLVLDPTVDEELVADARLTITQDEEGTINALQKGGNEGIGPEELNHMLDIASQKSKELRAVI
jgi:exosome complex component RRP42